MFPLSVRHKIAMFRNVEEAANSLTAIIKMLTNPENEAKFCSSVRSKLQGFNAAEISSKHMPSGAKIGSALTLVKSFLNGLPEAFVADTINKVIGKLSCQ